MANGPHPEGIEPDEHGLTRIFSEALEQSLKRSPPHAAADFACYAVRSYLSNMDAIDLTSKENPEPAYKLVLKRPEKRG